MSKLPNVISEKEFLEGLNKVKKKKIKLAFMLGFYQCMRISEICGLKKKVSRCCRAEIMKEKTVDEQGRKKTIYKCSQCLEIIDISNTLRSKTEWQINPLSIGDVNFNTGFMHLKNAKGGKDRIIPIMSPVRNGLKNLPIDIGIRALEKQVKNYWPSIHFHELRHSGATHYLNVGRIDIRHLQNLLGHSRLDTTQRYTKVDPKNLKDVFDGLWGE